jgi:hypothetical protein
MVKKFLQAILFFILIISIGMGINIYMFKDNISPTVATNSNEEIKGCGLFIANKNNNTHNQVIDFTNIDDYSYHLINKTGKDLECNLNVFINGNQIKLLNKESGNTDSNIKFSIKDNENKEIPIKLCLDSLPKGSYIANFNIVTDYNDYAVYNEQKVWVDSTYNYTVAIKNDDTVLSIQEVTDGNQEKDYIENIPDSSQLIPNYSKEEFKEGSTPKNCIEADAGSIIELPLILGGSDITESLIYATLDNNQILLNESKTLIYNLIENNASETKVKIHVPDKTGKYELLFFSLSNFRNLDIYDFGGIRFSTSHRITLVSK